MVGDPFIDTLLADFLDASDCYVKAADRLVKLAGTTDHSKFVEAAQRARELAGQVERARDALLRDRIGASARLHTAGRSPKL